MLAKSKNIFSGKTRARRAHHVDPLPRVIHRLGRGGDRRFAHDLVP